eukprot:scaffold27826_cov129-Isochrysis_galbana.AAC.2
MGLFPPLGGARVEVTVGYMSHLRTLSGAVLDLHGADRVSADGLGNAGVDAFGFAGMAMTTDTSEKDYDSEADYYAEAEATLAVLDTSARSPAALPVPLPAAR